MPKSSRSQNAGFQGIPLGSGAYSSSLIRVARDSDPMFPSRSRPVDFELSPEYMRNSLRVDSPEMLQIQQCAADHDIVVVLGFSENHHDTLYISQAIIGNDGKILLTRRKIKATHMERTIFGEPSAECLNSVVDTPVARIGALSCWEHLQPLLKYHTYNQREQIHVAAWPPLFQHGGGPDLWSMGAEGESALVLTIGSASELTFRSHHRCPSACQGVRHRVFVFCTTCHSCHLATIDRSSENCREYVRHPWRRIIGHIWARRPQTLYGFTRNRRRVDLCHFEYARDPQG